MGIEITCRPILDTTHIPITVKVFDLSQGDAALETHCILLMHAATR